MTFLSPRCARLLVVCLLLLVAFEVAAEPALCSTSRWSSIVGPVTTGTPWHAATVQRFSDPCALTVSQSSAYVVDASPSNEAKFHASFYYFARSFATSAPAVIFQAVSSTGAIIFSINATNSSLGFSAANGTSSPSATIVQGRWYLIEIGWTAATGQMAYAVSDIVVSETGGTLSTQAGSIGFVDPGWRVDSARLGIVSGTVTSGSIVLDAYKSSRIGNPTRVCRCDANGDGVVNSGDGIEIRNEYLQSALARGQPDCNGDGTVNSGDQLIARNLYLYGRSACPVD